MSIDRWKVILPDGRILLFDDWHTAHVEASLREYTLGVPLIPQPTAGTRPMARYDQMILPVASASIGGKPT